MVIRAREGLGNRFRGGWSWAMARLRLEGGLAGAGEAEGEGGIRFVLLHH